LRELRDYQTAIKLFDESAEEIVGAALRKQVETSLSEAVDVARAPGKARDPAAVVEVSHSSVQAGCPPQCWLSSRWLLLLLACDAVNPESENC
jgi:hypothetical protein